MAEDTGIRQSVVVLAVLAALASGTVALAQPPQSDLTTRGAKSAGASARAGSSKADAAAYQKLNTGLVDEAAAGFQAVLAAKPDDAGALAGMGQVRILQGNYLGAISFLERAKQADPNDAMIGTALDSARYQFLMSEGKDAQTAKDNEDAEKRYREALELEPDSPAVGALVNVLVMENKLSEAQDTLSSAIAHGAAATGHPPAELEMQLGQVDIANNQPQLAYPIFLQVLQDSPERVDAWSGLISSLHLMGHDGDAIAQEKAIPAETRTQLEATPGFGEMMTAMTDAPTKTAAASGPAYAPFVPTAAPTETTAPPAIAASTPAASPESTSAATVPASATTSATAAQASTAASHTAPGQMPAIAQPGAGTPIAPQVQAGAPLPVSTPPGSSASAGVVAPVKMPPPAAVPAVVSPAPKPVAAPTQTARATPAATQMNTGIHPASSTGRGAALVSQPAKRPPEREEVPDTGDQQYPQPKLRPRMPASASNSGLAPTQN